MHKRFFILWMAMAVTAYAIESAENLASHFAGLPLREQTMANLPKGREQEVLAALVARQSVYLETLLRLNYAPTVERVMTKFAAVEGKDRYLRRSIERSGSPYIIDELAPALYKNDLVSVREYGGDDGMDFGESAEAAEMIGQLIIRAPEFPPEAKEWAKKHLGGPGPNIIQAGRAWWELNQVALLANQFDKVKVPASYPAGVMPEKPAPKPAPPAATIAPPPEPDAPTTAVPSALVAPATVAPPPAKSLNPLWWIIGAITALVLVVLAALRKKPKP